MTTYLYQGRKVHLVAGRDADPDATVWVAFDDDPDRDAHVLPDELEEISPELEKIAHGALGLDTLADRGGDDVDFHDLHVAAIREALELAYAAGHAAGIAEARR